MTEVWFANYRNINTDLKFDNFFDDITPYGVALLDVEPATIERLKSLAIKEEIVESGHYEDDEGQSIAATGHWVEDDAETSPVRCFRFLDEEGDLILGLVIRPAFVMSASDEVS